MSFEFCEFAKKYACSWLNQQFLHCAQIYRGTDAYSGLFLLLGHRKADDLSLTCRFSFEAACLGCHGRIMYQALSIQAHLTDSLYWRDHDADKIRLLVTGVINMALATVAMCSLHYRHSGSTPFRLWLCIIFCLRSLLDLSCSQHWQWHTPLTTAQRHTEHSWSLCIALRWDSRPIQLLILPMHACAQNVYCALYVKPDASMQSLACADLETEREFTCSSQPIKSHDVCHSMISLIEHWDNQGNQELSDCTWPICLRTSLFRFQGWKG